MSMIVRHFAALVSVTAALTMTAPVQAGSTGDLTGLVRVDGHPEQNVVVWLVGVAAPAPVPEQAILDQRNLAFAPHVLVVSVGTSVEMPNNDRVFHNVFSFKDGKKFDLGLYPGDVGAAIRRDGLDTVLRAEGNAGPLTVGASFIDTTPYLPASFAHGRARFGGLDVRWMQGGVQLRGEWLGGRPFDGTSTTGGYLDLVVHRPAMGSLTALARVERLDYNTRPEFALHTYRYGAAVRLRVWQGVSASVGLSHQGGKLTQRRRTAIDAGLGYTLRMIH